MKILLTKKESKIFEKNGCVKIKVKCEFVKEYLQKQLCKMRFLPQEKNPKEQVKLLMRYEEKFIYDERITQLLSYEIDKKGNIFVVLTGQDNEEKVSE